MDSASHTRPIRQAHDEDGLREWLKSYNIFFITLSGVIGGGLFYTNGGVFLLSGPDGVLTAVIVVGIIVICVLECISELVQLFPAPLAVYFYSETFLDPDLGWVASTAYWFTYSSIFAIQNVNAAESSRYWDMPESIRVLLFYIIIPVVLTALNMAPLRIFGWVETIGGALKTVLAFGCAVLFYVLTRSEFVGHPKVIDDGFTNAAGFPSQGAAVCTSIPIVAFSYLSVDAVVVTAREANPDALGWPSRYVAWLVVVLYLMTAIGAIANVKWNDPALPALEDWNSRPVQASAEASSAMIIIAVQEAIQNGAEGLQAIPGFLNVAFIISQLSSGSTGLYMASRTLHGIARHGPDIEPRNSVAVLFKKLSVVPRGFQAPAPAVFVSAVAFFWLPFLRLTPATSAAHLFYIIENWSNYALLVVWAVVCASFLRFYLWTRSFTRDDDVPLYDRSSVQYGAFTLLGWLQPIPAMVGLIGSLLVIIFGTGLWWAGPPPSFVQVTATLGAPFVMLCAWVMMKAWVMFQLIDNGNDLDDAISKAFRMRPDGPGDLKEILRGLAHVQVNRRRTEASAEPSTDAREDDRSQEHASPASSNT